MTRPFTVLLCEILFCIIGSVFCWSEQWLTLVPTSYSQHSTKSCFYSLQDIPRPPKSHKWRTEPQSFALLWVNFSANFTEYGCCYCPSQRLCGGRSETKHGTLCCLRMLYKVVVIPICPSDSWERFKIGCRRQPRKWILCYQSFVRNVYACEIIFEKWKSPASFPRN